MPTFRRSIGAAFLAIAVFLGAADAGAQTTTPPAGMTQEQFNALVDAISNSVADKLKAEGAHAAPEAAPAAAASSKSKGKVVPPPSIVRTPLADGPGPFAVFIERTGHIVRAVPALGAKLASI